MATKTVYVELVAETRKLNEGMKKADRRVSKLTTGFKKLGGAIVAAFGARAVFRGLQQTFKVTDALVKNAKGVGFTATEYERLAFSLSEVGVEAGSAKIAIGDFQKRLSKAVGGSSPQFAKAFKEAGLDIKALSRMSPAAAFESAFGTLAGQLGDPRIAGLFGNVFEEQSGKDMLKAARQMERLVQARSDYDRIVKRGLSGTDAKNIEEVGRQTRLLGLQWEVLKRNIVLDAAPQILAALEEIEASGAFTSMADSMTALVKETNSLIEDVKYLASVFDGLDASIPDWMKTLFQLQNPVNYFKAVGKAPFEVLRDSRLKANPPSTAREVSRSEMDQARTLEIKVDATGDSSISRRNADRVGASVAREVHGR